jgi:hypothetical protein
MPFGTGFLEWRDLAFSLTRLLFMASLKDSAATIATNSPGPTSFSSRIAISQGQLPLLTIQNPFDATLPKHLTALVSTQSPCREEWQAQSVEQSFDHGSNMILLNPLGISPPIR